MKPVLFRKKPLTPNYPVKQAYEYAEFYSYLEHHTSGPYYIDDIILPDIRILLIEPINVAIGKIKKPQLSEYINKWYPDRNFNPAEATFFIWVTYQEKIINKHNSNDEFIMKEGSLDYIINRKGKSRGLQLCMDQEQAGKLLECFNYLIKNCVLLPGYSIIESMDVVTLALMAENNHEFRQFINNRKNGDIFSQGDHTIMVKLSGDYLIGGQFTNCKYMTLFDVLNEFKVKMISMQE